MSPDERDEAERAALSHNAALRVKPHGWFPSLCGAAERLADYCANVKTRLNKDGY